MKHVQQSPRFGFWVYVIIAAAMAYIIAVSPASAHALWKPGSITPPRSDDMINNLKAAPCGNLPRGNNPAVFQKGTEIMVEWVESINHNGYFQIRFSPIGSPAAQTDFTLQLPIKKDANDNNPQLNYIDDQSGPVPNFFSGLITLPDVECTDCTLQLMQVMVANNGGESFYYSCSDIKLVANDPNDVTPPADVLAFAAAPGDTLVDLSWTNPAADFYRTLVLQSANAIVDVPNTGTEYQVDDPVGNSTVVYVGNGQTHQVTGLNNGTTYHYKAFAYDLSKNYAAGVPAQAALPAQAVNQAPVLSELFAVQGGNDTATVTTGGGNVQIPAQVSDPNPGDQHSYDWSNTDAALVDLNAAPDIFEFDPMTVPLGAYAVSVAVTDNGTPQLGDTKMITVNVVANSTPPPATPPAPVTNNGTSSGCTVDPSARFSPLFVLMLAGAVFYLVTVPRRRRAQVRTRHHH